ncbi:hypothetical protein PMIN06_005803 [Paraphaeosphaeria minitans]
MVCEGKEGRRRAGQQQLQKEGGKKGRREEKQRVRSHGRATRNRLCMAAERLRKVNGHRQRQGDEAPVAAVRSRRSRDPDSESSTKAGAVIQFGRVETGATHTRRLGWGT